MKAVFSNYIGKHLTIVRSSVRSLVGVTGVVVDETAATFTLALTTGRKRVIKHTISFTVDGSSIIHGKMIARSPEERLKMRI